MLFFVQVPNRCNAALIGEEEDEVWIEESRKVGLVLIMF